MVEVIPATRPRRGRAGEADDQRRLSLRRIKTIGTAAAMAVLASLAVAPAAHAGCPEEPCNAPAPDPTYPVYCVVTYDGPVKGITSCFDPRP